MRYNQMGNTGLKVSELCLGTMTFGEAGDSNPMWGAIAGLSNFKMAVRALPLATRA